MPKKGLYFIVRAQTNEYGRIVLVKEQAPQLQAYAHFPELERMQLSDAQASALLRVGESRSQVRANIKDGGLFLRACAAAATKESLL